MIENVIEEEAEEVAGQFEEEVSLSLYDLRHTYCEFTVSKVDGCTPSHMLIVSFYDNQIYLPSDRRDGLRKLSIFDMGPKDDPSRYSIADCSVRRGDSDAPVSMREMLKKAYLRKCRTPEGLADLALKEAEKAADEALGLRP